MEHHHTMRQQPHHHHSHLSPHNAQQPVDNGYYESSTEEDHESMGPCGEHMSMAFHFGIIETILFKFWSTQSTWAMIGSCVVVFVLGVFYEGLKFYRAWLFKRRKTSRSAEGERATSGVDRPTFQAFSFKRSPGGGGIGGATGTDTVDLRRTSILSAFHFYQTLLHMLQVTVSFLLMLIFMTFNVWLCFAVVLGAGLGYFLFFWHTATVSSEHCN